MARRIFEAALQNRLMTMILIVVFVMIGLRAMLLLPIDASPDVTPNVVQIVTDAPGLGAGEVENLITFPVGVSMRGLPGIREIRSVSRFGLSSVQVYFDEKFDTYFVRRLVMERLPDAEATFPNGYGPPEMTPVSTGLGEIFQFEVIDRQRSPMELRSILDWRIAPRLKEVPGVVEVNSFGGELKTYEVQVRPETLVAYKLTLGEVFHALEVHNEGPPIRKELLGTMFDPLVRGRSSTQDPTGLGLGLFIVKEIASAHKGAVSVTSSEDSGTTFSVSLPRY